MVFKNEKELERFVLKKCRLALIKAEDEIYKILKDFLRKFYMDYEPDSYQRTYQLLQSLVQSRVVSDGKGYKAEVYFALDNLSYAGGNPSGEQVMDAASQGLHGAIGDIPNSRYNSKFQYIEGDTGVSVWNGAKGPIKILDAKAIEILKDMLIAEGIPIK